MKLRSLLAFAMVSLVAGSVWAQQSASLTVNVTNVCLLPKKGNVGTPSAWVAGAGAAVGSLSSSGGYTYMKMTEGTNDVTAPTHATGIATNGGAIQLRVAGHDQIRKGLAISFVSGVATAFVNFGSAAVANSGYALKPGDPPLVIQESVPQGAVHVISSANGAVVSALEW